MSDVWHPDMPPEYRNQIVTGDARELAKRIPDKSVDLIFTDPPYPREFEHVFREMGEYAPRILKPGGSLITLCGHYQVPMVIDALHGLSYRWIGWVQSAQKPTLFGYRVVCGGKPILWFAKGRAALSGRFWWDTKPANGSDKRYHEWGQDVGWAMRDIALFTEPGNIVYDPFTGGGTVPAVCKMLGRNYVTSEIDPDVAERARERVLMTQPPLFVLEPEQMGMWG